MTAERFEVRGHFYELVKVPLDLDDQVRSDIYEGDELLVGVPGPLDLQGARAAVLGYQAGVEAGETALMQRLTARVRAAVATSDIRVRTP